MTPQIMCACSASPTAIVQLALGKSATRPPIFVRFASTTRIARGRSVSWEHRRISISAKNAEIMANALHQQPPFAIAPTHVVRAQMMVIVHI
jgi:hypothetical protein